MTALLTLVAALFVGGPLALATWAFFDAGRFPPVQLRERRLWQGMLLASVLSASAVPGPALTSAERTRIIEGPDLLSDIPIVRTEAPDRSRMWGFGRVKTVRETQDGRLLREITRDVIDMPLLPLLLGLGWLYRGRRRIVIAASNQGAESADPQG